MQMLSDDDLNIRGLSLAELESAWDLWFDLASATDPFDPPYSHGVFVGLERLPQAEAPVVAPRRAPAMGPSHPGVS
jgi:hypothetical protein